jgi:hypothetical protein
MEPDAELVQEIQSAELTGSFALIGRGGTAARSAQPKDRSKLPKAIAVPMRFGRLLDFPEHPYESGTQADDDA